MRRMIALSILALALLGGEIKVEKEFKVAPGVRLKGEIVAGSMDVKAWEKPEVKVSLEVYYKGEKPRVKLEKEGNQVVFSVDYPRSFCFFSCHRNYRAVARVFVPRDYSPDLHGVSASITVRGGFLREGEVHSVSGDVVLEGISFSRLYLKTVSGDISVMGKEGEKLVATSVSGDISILLSHLKCAKIRSISGDLKLKGASEDRWKLSTVSGDIVVLVPSMPCYMRLSSTGGEIHLPRMEIRGKVEKEICSQGLSLKAGSVSGDIYLKVQNQ